MAYKCKTCTEQHPTSKRKVKHKKECRKKLVLKVCLKSLFFPHMKPPK